MKPESKLLFFVGFFAVIIIGASFLVTPPPYIESSELISGDFYSSPIYYTFTWNETAGRFEMNGTINNDSNTVDANMTFYFKFRWNETTELWENDTVRKLKPSVDGQ